MAEHLLCLLFVTSSSRGRNVFRYPPQAAAPGPRLTQPIYPSATYTAADTAVQPKRHIHFGPTIGRGVTVASHKVWDDGSSDGTAAQARVHTLGQALTSNALDYGSDTYETEYETEPSSSDESDLDTVRMNRHWSKDGGLPNQESNTSLARRPSNMTEHHELDRFDESKYNSALGYSLDFLSDMLTPPRSASNRKFEICVDELVFIGHPVYIGPDGKWSYPAEPEEDSEVRPTARGRRTKERESGNQLDTVEEGKEVISPVDATPRKMESEQGVPTLNMFHLVLIFDKPDPKPAAQMGEGPAPLTLLDEMYREIAFKWAAAAFALQVGDGYIAREAWEMAKWREKGINESQRCHVVLSCKIV